MIGHVVTLNKLMQNFSFNNLKNKLKRMEVILLLLTVLIFTSMLLFGLVSVTMIEQPTKKMLERTQILIIMSSKPILLVSFVILYQMLLRTLRKNLYFYYRKQKNKLFVLAVSNIYFFAVSFIINVLEYFNYFEEMLITEGEYHILLNATYVILLWTYYFSYYFVIYYNIKNINFKKYLKDVYTGLRIQHHYEGASIYIVKS